MNEVLATIIQNHLHGAVDDDVIKEIIDKNTIVSFGRRYSVFHPDILRTSIGDDLIDKSLSTKDKILKVDELISLIAEDFRIAGYGVLDKWAVEIEPKTCTDCPAYQWVIHRKGTHTCRLGFDIRETEDNGWKAQPVSACLRPLSVGASYLIARELNLPEPMVGKLDAWQYDQYCEERDKICP